MEKTQYEFLNWCRDGELGKIKEVVENGFCIYFICGNWTPLQMASYYCRYEVVEYLIDQECDVNEVDVHGVSPLMCLCASGDQDRPENEAHHIARLLINKGADIALKDISGESAMRRLSYSANSKLISELLLQGADVNDLFDSGVCGDEVLPHIASYEHQLTPENRVYWKKSRLLALYKTKS